LFVPPPQFHKLARDPVAVRRIERSGGTFIAEYVRTVHQNAGSVVFSRTVEITIGTNPAFGLNPYGFAQTKLALLRRHTELRKVQLTPVTLCGGRQGWMLSYEAPAPVDQRLSELYAPGATTLYFAITTYHDSAGDLGSVSALRSLCPPAVQHAAPSFADLPFTLPHGWNPTTETADRVSAPFTEVGRWLRLPDRASHLQSLELIKGPPLSPGESPADHTQAVITSGVANAPGFALETSRAQGYCASDGWFASYVLDSGANEYTIDTAYAYATGASYFLAYERLSKDPEDPLARRALQSLCPPVSAGSRSAAPAVASPSPSPGSSPAAPSDGPAPTAPSPEPAPASAPPSPQPSGGTPAPQL
jgi:hypothetical protein